MRFGTVVNCTDGRVQYPVMDYLQSSFGTSITYMGLYVDEQWEVEEYTRLESVDQD